MKLAKWKNCDPTVAEPYSPNLSHDATSRVAAVTISEDPSGRENAETYKKDRLVMVVTRSASAKQVQGRGETGH